MTKERSDKKEEVEGRGLVKPANDKKSTKNGGGSGVAGKEKKAEKGPTRQRHSSEDSEASLESLEEYIPTPPDGGWGWVIVCSSMMCNLIVDGIGYSFGVFLSEFVEAFNEPKSKVSLVGSLLCGTYLFAGPVVSAMTNKYGCRPVVIVGSCIATVAFILARFSPTIEILILTYGVLGGFGLGMVYLPSIVSVGYYFEKKRAFATGLAVCGSGLGTFIFPPLSEVLLHTYSWQGGLLIIAGIIFNGCLCGALMRPLTAKPSNQSSSKKPRAKNFMDRLKETTRDRTISESSNAAHSVGNKTQIQEKVMFAKLQREQHLQDTDSDTGSLPSIAFVKRGDSLASDHRRLSGGIPVPVDPRRSRLSVSSAAESGNSPARDVSGSPASKYARSPGATTSPLSDVKADGQISPDSDSEVKVSDTVESAVIISDSASTDEYYTPPVSVESTEHNTPSKEPTVTTEKVTSQNSDNKLPNGSSQPFVSEIVPLIEVPAPVIRTGVSQGGSRTNMMNLQSLTSLHISKKDLARPLYRKDIFYSGSIVNIPQYRSQPDMKSYITSITTIPGEMEFVEGPSPSSKCINILCSCLPRPARDILSEMVDVSLFKDISFMLICLGNVLAFLGFYVPFVFLVDRTVSLGVDKTQATFLISIIGITNTVGRVIIGKLADLHIVDSLVITYISIAICGVVTGLIPYCNTYPLLAANASVFGLGMAAYISLSSIIICDRMGLDKLTNAFGLLSMVRGIAGMSGPPLAGFMYDSSGSYDLSFYLGGLLLLIGAGCHVLLHLPALRPPRHGEYTLEEVAGDEVLQIMGSKPQIITVEEALSSE